MQEVALNQPAIFEPFSPGHANPFYCRTGQARRLREERRRSQAVISVRLRLHLVRGSRMPYCLRGHALKTRHRRWDCDRVLLLSGEFSEPRFDLIDPDIRPFTARHNEKPKPYRWTKSA